MFSWMSLLVGIPFNGLSLRYYLYLCFFLLSRFFSISSFLSFCFSSVDGSFLLMLSPRQRKTSVPSAQVPWACSLHFLHLSLPFYLARLLWTLHASNFIVMMFLLGAGEAGVGKTTGKPLHFKGSSFHRVIKGFMAQVSMHYSFATLLCSLLTYNLFFFLNFVCI